MKRPAWPRDVAADESFELKRWMAAGVIVCVAHAAGIAAGLLWQPQRNNVGDAPPAIMVELAPVAVAPEPTPLDIAPGPLMTEAKPEPKPEPKPEEKEIPELKKSDAEVVLPEKAEEKPKENEKPKELLKYQAPQTTAPPKLKVKRAETMAAPTAGSTENSAFANANWRGAVVAHLNRFKRFPGGGTSGTAVVAFSIDAGGRVTGARLVRGSGNPTIDADAVAMVWRASPVPAPPPSVSRGGSIGLTVPVRYVR